MMSWNYIDTSSLKWRYLNGTPTAAVNNLLDDPSERVVTPN